MVGRTVRLTVSVSVNGPSDRPTRPVSVNGFGPSRRLLTEIPNLYRFRFPLLTGTHQVPGNLLGTRYRLYPAPNPGYDPKRYRYEGSAFTHARPRVTAARALTATGEAS